MVSAWPPTAGSALAHFSPPWWTLSLMPLSMMPLPRHTTQLSEACHPSWHCGAAGTAPLSRGTYKTPVWLETFQVTHQIFLCSYSIHQPHGNHSLCLLSSDAKYFPIKAPLETQWSWQLENWVLAILMLFFLFLLIYFVSYPFFKGLCLKNNQS